MTSGDGGRALRLLLLANGAFNALGAAVLFGGAKWLSGWLTLSARDAFLWYLLGGASLALAVLSLGASRLEDPAALRLVAWVFVVFHGAAALTSAWAALTGLTPLVWANCLAHAAFTILFWRLGLGRARHGGGDSASRGPSPA
jgi:hypothetical protein